MKTVIIYPDNLFQKYQQDEWDSFRSEGRFSINIGFGLSLLGYDVNIVYSEWTFDGEKVAWNNVKLSKESLREYYDIGLAFRGPSVFEKPRCGKSIFMGYEPKHVKYAKEFMDQTGIQLTFVCPFKYGMDEIKNMANFPIHYFPTLFPIPHINRGFLPYSYNLNSSELKIYLHYAGWPTNFSISGERFAHKEQLIIGYLTNSFKDKKIRLYAHVGSRQKTSNNGYYKFATNEDFPIKCDEINYFYNTENNYLSMINLLKSVDICITVGSAMFGGNSLVDIISLGKPLLYIAERRADPGERIANAIYNSPNDLIYIDEPDSDTISKLEKFISNPKETYDRFRDIYKDYDFDNWKNPIQKILT